MVFGFHVGTLNLIQPDRWHKAWDSIFGLGASGVSFFFVLSGFVLAWSARPGDTKLGFWRRRLAKIYPNHLAMFLIVLLVMVAWGDRLDLTPVLANLFLVQTWPWADGYAYTVNSVSWTLCCELFFYLCLPFVLPTLRRVPTGWIYAGLIALPLLILLISNPEATAACSRWSSSCRTTTTGGSPRCSRRCAAWSSGPACWPACC